MTQTRDLIKKMADFFRGEEFYEKGEDARLELSSDDVRCMYYLIQQRNKDKYKEKSEMQIVINIPEKLACEDFERPFTEEEKNVLIKAIGNGTPLPKGHGRLIDADKLEYDKISFETDSDAEYLIIGKEDIDDAPTIIEANNTESESKE